jgi:hypothetical protein
MDKRRYERKPFRLKAGLIVDNQSYSCFTQNLSEYGAYIELDTSETPIEFYPETSVELKFQLPSGETLTVHGEVRWSRVNNTPSDHYETHVGIEILKPPSKFREFLKTPK